MNTKDLGEGAGCARGPVGSGFGARAFLASSPLRRPYAYGEISRDVARVEVLLGDGRVIELDVLGPRQVPGNYYFGFLPRRFGHADIIAYNDGGDVSARSEVCDPCPGEKASGARGPLEFCPDLEGTEPLDRVDPSAPARVAIRLDRAIARDEVEVFARLIDPSTRTPSPGWASTTLRGELEAVSSRSARNDGLVINGCGQAVAERSWVVTVRDSGSASASVGAASFYLVLPDTGWKVWGSY